MAKKLRQPRPFLLAKMLRKGMRLRKAASRAARKPISRKLARHWYSWPQVPDA